METSTIPALASSTGPKTTNRAPQAKARRCQYRQLHRLRTLFSVRVEHKERPRSRLHEKKADSPRPKGSSRWHLEGREKASGSEDRKTLEIFNHLGALEALKGVFISAERLLRRALAGFERHYGPGYTIMQSVVCNFGLRYLGSAHCDKAKHYLSHAAHNLKSALRSAHLLTPTTFHSQACYISSNMNIQLLERNSSARLSVGRPVARAWRIAKAIGRVALSVHEMVEMESVEAEALLRDAATLYEHAFGKEHPQTVKAGKRADEARTFVKIVGMNGFKSYDEPKLDERGSLTVK